MKKVLVILMAIAMLMLCSCSSGEETIIIGESNKVVDDAIDSTPAPPAEYEAEVEETERPRWQETFVSETGINVVIDAEIVIPDVENFPVVAATPSRFSAEDAQKYAKLLFGDVPLYNYEMYGMTVPEESKLTKTDWTFQETETDSTLIVMNSKGGYLQISNNKTRGDAFLSYAAKPRTSAAYWTWPLAEKGDEGAQKAAEKAIAMAEALGIENAAAVGIYKGGSPDKPMYYIFLSRTVGGIAPAHKEDFFGTQAFEVDDAPMEDVAWPEEQIEMFVSGDEVIEINWRHTQQMGEVKNENVSILPLEDIKPIITKMLDAKLKEHEESFLFEGDSIVIDTVTLGVMRVRHNSKDGTENLYFPVWDAVGEIEGPSARTEFERISFLTVNAIDGSNIDRGLGY